jgi:LPXTG-motif cell wall-anchored protein
MLNDARLILLLCCFLVLAACGEDRGPYQIVHHKNPVPFSVDKLLKKLPWGSIAFNKPNEMNYGEVRTVRLLLSKGKSPDELEVQLRALGSTEKAQIRISDQMEAELTADGSAFVITPLTKGPQLIGSAADTEWKWDVRPKSIGKQKLHLAVYSRLKVDNNDSHYLVKTFDEEIEVTIRSMSSAFVYAGDNWTMLAGIVTLIGGLLAWLLRKRKPEDTGTD